MAIVLRKGRSKLGGLVVELATPSTRLLLDVGCERDGLEVDLPRIEGPVDPSAYDAVVVDPLHTDNTGKVLDLYRDVPVYVGANTWKAVAAIDAYKGQSRPAPAGLLVHGEAVRIGDLTVVPYLCDHASFDGFLLEIEAGRERVLFAGDFRSNGRKPFAWLLRQLPARVDVLLCPDPASEAGEAVPAGAARNEQELEYDAIDLFRSTKGPIFALVSSTDAVRLATLHQAARVAHRTLLMDLFLSHVTASIGPAVPNPIDSPDVKSFATRYYEKAHFRSALAARFTGRRLGKAGVARTPFVMCVRSSMLPYVKSLKKELSFAGGIVAVSAHEGYRRKESVKAFLAECRRLGLRIVDLHAEGRPEERAVRKLVDHAHPARVVPIRTQRKGWYRVDGDPLV